MLIANNIVGVACGVFSPELKHLESQGDLSFPVIYLNSMLHMHPKQLEAKLNGVLQKQLHEQKKVLLLFGDCHARMFQMEEQKNVARLQGGNCIEILLGPVRYKEIQKNKSFVLMKEWAERWEEVFTKGLGFNRETAQMFMPEHHSELLYADCGIDPVPEKVLDACADFCGLSWSYEPISLDPLCEAISTALRRLEKMS